VFSCGTGILISSLSIETRPVLDRFQDSSKRGSGKNFLAAFLAAFCATFLAAFFAAFLPTFLLTFFPTFFPTFF